MGMSKSDEEAPATPARPARPFVPPPAAGRPDGVTRASAAAPRPFVPRSRTDRSAPTAPAPTPPPLAGREEADRWLDQFVSEGSAREADAAASGFAPAGEVDAAVVPGAEARPRAVTPVATPAAPDDADLAAGAEWAAMTELGDFETPAAREPRPTPSARSVSDKAVAVIPPAQAWPEDVWSEPAGPPAAPTPAPDAHVLVTAGNDLAPPVAPAGPNGTVGGDAPPVSYPPALPDGVDDYALDGAPADLGAPSPVYRPDRAADWAEAAGAVVDPDERAGGGAASTEPITVDRVEAATAGSTASVPHGALAARLRRLADELDARSLAVPTVTPEMRDTEALVALLGALLRGGR